MKKDPAKVAAHELEHFNNASDEANKPMSEYPDIPANDITGLDPKQDENEARDAEDLDEKLPNEPSVEAIKAIEKTLERNPPKKEKP